MFNLKKYLRYLWRQGIDIWLEGNQLRYSSNNETQDQSRLKILEDHRQDIIELLNKEGDIYRGFPLSEGQRSIKLMQDMVPGSNAYHQVAALELSTSTDISCLKESITKLTQRHECLRVNIVNLDGELAQQVNRNPRPMLSLHSVDNYDDTAIAEWIDQQSDTPFDLEKDPLFRFSLLDNRSAAEGSPRWVLVAVAHHLIADFWTLEMVLKELVATYTLAQLNQEPPLPELTASYKDFVLAEANMLVSERGKAHWEYLQQIISEPPPPLQLPTDYPRPSQQQFHGKELFFELDTTLSAAIRECSKQLGITPYVFMLSAYQVLLQRSSGEDTIVVGTPMACRSQPGAKHVAGLYTNPIPMVAQFEDDPSFAELTAQTRQQVKGGMAHQEFPFQQIVDRLQPERDLSRPPIFQTAMVWNQLSNALPEVGGDNWVQSIIRMGMRGAIYDLVMTCFDTGAELRTGIRYNSDLFKAETIQRFSDHLRCLLESIVSDPGQTVSALTYLTEAEQQQLFEWNQTSTSYPDNNNVAQLFEQQAAQQPDAPALSFGNTLLSYDELNAKANRVAHRLQQAGVRPGDFVAICLDRSTELIITILAIVKTGAAYVPIDPDYPDERVGYMLEDTESPVIVTQSCHQARLASIDIPTGNPQLICLDQEDLASQSDQWNTENSAKQGIQTACVLFTSGSTGRPKGVLIPHRGVARLVLNTNYMQLSPDDVMAHISNVSFDAATWEVWGALLNGAQLQAIDKETLLNPDIFEKILSSGKITAMLLTSALFNLYVSRNPALFKRLNYLLVGGEALDPSKIRAVLKAGGPAHLINAYGPTENSTIVTCQEITDIAENASTVPIGKPIANTSAYILDKHGKQVAVGVVGEIFAGGDGVSQGYLKRPQLSTEKFTADPFSKRAQATMYGTGDLGRFTPNGSIEIIGRIDDQVKIRGHRIELSEIENKINSDASVAASTVIVCNEGGQRFLSAYVVPRQDQNNDPKEYSAQLKAALRRQLPEYMLPSTIVLMAALPLTANGKLDRRALPTPKFSSDQDYVAPRTELEQQITNLWQQSLQVEKIGIYDNFFDLGGHSLLATQTASRLQELLQRPVTMRNLFEAPTVADLSELLEMHQRSSTLPPILSGERPSPLPLALSQQRLWIVDRLDPGNVAYNMPAALRFHGKLDEQALKRALQTIIERHESLRTCFKDIHGQAIQQIDDACLWEMPITDLSETDALKQEEQIKTRAREQATHAFDLSNSPLFRIELLRLSTDDHVLLFCMHHIISDGWSVEVLLSELGQLWQAYEQGDENPLPELPVQYGDFTVWQREALQGEYLEQQLDYWRKQLAGAPSLLQLPTDKPRPPQQSLNGAVHRFEIPRPIVDKLKKLAQQHNASLFMALLSAYSVLLNRYSQQDDICIGFPISGRNLPELEPLIGLFVNNLVIRAEFSDKPSFCELLDAVRQTTLEAYDHQDLPFDHIIEGLNLERSLSYTPLLQVSFSLQNQTMEQQIAQMLGRKAQLLDINWLSAKYDLHMICFDSEDNMSVELEYCQDLFEHSTIERMAQQFNALLEALLEAPQKNIGSINLTPAHESTALLSTEGNAWNATQIDYAAPPALQLLFEQQVKLTPNAPAIVDENKTWTYLELNERANQLAFHLTAKGVGPDSIVGVCMERCLEMSVALLAILKAGGAYAPFDPSFPRDRLAFMAEDTAINILLSQRHLDNTVPCNAEVLFIDEADAWQDQPRNNPINGVEGKNLFNVIYTSGSTGKPKGVMVTHQGIINRLLWMQATYPIDAQDNILQKTPYSFDVSVWELFWPLITGAKLVYAKPDGHKDADYLKKLIQQETISTLHFVPSMLGIFLQAQNVADCDSIKRIFCSGEALQLEHERRFFEQLPQAELHNLYGPTEASVDVSYFACQKDSHYRSVPIGKPVANTQLHILDENLQPVPIGMVGELYIGGTQLARGYLNREELTKNTFIENPFYKGGDAHPSSRLYKTGDLARYQNDGNIEYIGRVDFQVKVRGLRIELGEIENVLHQHASVKETIVITKEISAENVVIVAYIVAEIDSAEVEDLRRHLARQLPEYMLPNAFVFLEAMPLSPNGKVNRKQLPEPELSASARAPYEAPRNETECALVDIWQEVLNQEQIGINDNFFELGGHSLLATQVSTRINERFNTDLPLKLIFETPTIAELALNLLESELDDIDDEDMEALLAELLDEEDGDDMERE